MLVRRRELCCWWMERFKHLCCHSIMCSAADTAEPGTRHALALLDANAAMMKIYAAEKFHRFRWGRALQKCALPTITVGWHEPQNPSSLSGRLPPSSNSEEPWIT
jgi:hypothetical protein